MSNKVQRSIRLDPDVMQYLKSNSGGNVNRFIEDLLMKGLLCDINEMHKEAAKTLLDAKKDDHFVEFAEFILRSRNIRLQSHLLIKSCKELGICTEYVQKNVNSESTKDDLFERLNFHSNLIFHLAVKAGVDADILKNWVSRIQEKY